MTPDREKWIGAVTAAVVVKSDVTDAELIEHVRGSLSKYTVSKRCT